MVAKDQRLRRIRAQLRRRPQLAEGSSLVDTNEPGFMGKRLVWRDLRTGIGNIMLDQNDVMSVGRFGLNVIRKKDMKI